MPGLDFMIHLPLLRIEEEKLPFGPGLLYRMPFEKYNEISLGAFSEQERQYTATEPVFLAFSAAVPDDYLERRTSEVRGLTEIKILWHRLLRRSASESGRLCQGDGRPRTGAC